MTKRGSIKYQATRVLNGVRRYKVSRHELKRKGDADLFITSIETMKDYCRASVGLALWCKRERAVRDIRQITPAMAEEYVQNLCDRELSGGYIGKVVAAIRKFDRAMRWMKERPKSAPPLLSEDLRGWHSDGRPERAYTPEAAERIIAAIPQHTRDPQTVLVARVQRAFGARIREASKLHGDGIDVEGCRVTLKGKGGKVRTVGVDARWQGFLAELKERAAGHRDGYVFQGRRSMAVRTRNAVRQACRHLGEPCYSTHGFRKCYAQEQYRELRAEGLADKEARLDVSRLLGHNRLDVTYSYIPR